MKYEVLRTDSANDDLVSIIDYVSNDSLDRALRYLDRLETEIMKLSEFPELGTYPKYRALKLKRIRLLIIDNYLVFYRVEEEKRRVIILRILNGATDYNKLI